MTQAQIESAVRNFVADKFMFGQGADKLSADTSFLESGLIDSTGVLELVMFIEDNYRVKVSDDEMLPENLDSIRAIAAFVTRKLASRSAA
jgi:acyl carrier protein